MFAVYSLRSACKPRYHCLVRRCTSSADSCFAIAKYSTKDQIHSCVHNFSVCHCQFGRCYVRFVVCCANCCDAKWVGRKPAREWQWHERSHMQWRGSHTLTHHTPFLLAILFLSPNSPNFTCGIFAAAVSQMCCCCCSINNTVLCCIQREKWQTTVSICCMAKYSLA